MVLLVVRTEGQNDIGFFSAKGTVPYSFPGTKGSPLKISYSVANSEYIYTHTFWNTLVHAMEKTISHQNRFCFKTEHLSNNFAQKVIFGPELYSSAGTHTIFTRHYLVQVFNSPETKKSLT